jgi:hypothetical protein
MTSALRASLAKRITGISWVAANRSTAARKLLPSLVKVAGEGIGLPRCWVRKPTTCPPTWRFGTYAFR